MFNLDALRGPKLSLRGLIWLNFRLSLSEQTGSDGETKNSEGFDGYR